MLISRFALRLSTRYISILSYTILSAFSKKISSLIQSVEKYFELSSKTKISRFGYFYNLREFASFLLIRVILYLVLIQIMILCLGVLIPMTILIYCQGRKAIPRGSFALVLDLIISFYSLLLLSIVAQNIIAYSSLAVLLLQLGRYSNSLFLNSNSVLYYLQQIGLEGGIVAYLLII